MVTNAPAGLRLLIRAMSQAITGKTVAHLSIPKDLWTQSVQAEPGVLPALVKDAARGYFTGDMDRAVSLMQKAHKPLVLVGRRGIGAAGEIRQLAAAWGGAVVVAQDAKGVLPDSLPEVVGGSGEAWMPSFLPDVDCIIMIGSATFEEKFLPRVATIQLEEMPWQINDIYLWDSLAGDVPYIINLLTEGLKGYTLPISAGMPKPAAPPDLGWRIPPNWQIVCAKPWLCRNRRWSMWSVQTSGCPACNNYVYV